MMWIVLAILIAVVAVVLVVLAHPAFGVYRRVSKERIQHSPNYYDAMFQNQEPTQQFTGDVNGKDAKNRTFKMLWRFLSNKDTVRIPQEMVEEIDTVLEVTR